MSLLTTKEIKELKHHCQSYVNGKTGEHRKWVVRADYGLALIKLLEAAEKEIDKLNKKVAILEHANSVIVCELNESREYTAYVEKKCEQAQEYQAPPSHMRKRCLRALSDV